MKKHSCLLYNIFFMVMCCITFFNVCACEVKKRNIPPKAKKEKYERVVHGDIVADYYHWLEDKNWPNVKSADVKNYLKEENQYTENYFLPLKDQEEKLVKEMKDRIVEDEETYPKKYDNYYYRKLVKNGNYFQVCRRKGALDAREEVILDVNHLAEGKAKGYKGLCRVC